MEANATVGFGSGQAEKLGYQKFSDGICSTRIPTEKFGYTRFSGAFGSGKFRPGRVVPKIMEGCIVVDILSSHRLVYVENES